jgi:hypothetical protein
MRLNSIGGSMNIIDECTEYKDIILVYYVRTVR